MTIDHAKCNASLLLVIKRPVKTTVVKIYLNLIPHTLVFSIFKIISRVRFFLVISRALVSAGYKAASTLARSES